MPKPPLKVLWISPLPSAVQKAALGPDAPGYAAATSWILAHLPPPPEVELHIATLWPGGTERKSLNYQGACFHLIPCPARGRATVLFLRDTELFRPLFNEIRPDVVHGWGTEDSFGLVARRLAPACHVVGIQGLITEYRKRVKMPRRTLLIALTERWTLRKARWVVAESAYSLNAARPLCPEARLREIEHPLREEFLRNTMADGTANSVLFVGNIDERKGVTDALLSFADVAPQDWRLQLVGSGSPEAESALLHRAEHLGLKSRFIHHRVLDPQQLAALMQQNSVFLLPTRIDTGPTALKEALAMGLWPVCYDNSGPGEYVRHFQFGSLAADLDSGDLRAHLAEAIRTRPWKDPSRRERLQQQTRNRFSKAAIWQNLLSLYIDVQKVVKNST